LVTTNQFVTGLFCSGFFLAGIYLLMQIHQVEEDRERGDVSFAVRFGKNSTIIFALVLFLLAGILGVSSFIFSELFFELSILVPYFVIGILLTIVWKKKNGPLSDYKIMSRITDYFSFTGSALLIIIYIVSNTW
jgi:4-hydroxybenzoate polyprenyltransferase